MVAILALLASFVLPNLGAVRARDLQHAAERLAARLELARERSIVTGTPHRLYLDLDDAAYRIEWYVSEARSLGEPEPDAAPEPVLAPGLPLDLAPPQQKSRAYYPLPGMFGRLEHLDAGLDFAGVEDSQGWTARGESSIAFDRDGTTDFATLVLKDDSGRSLALEILPLSDRVRIRHETR